MQERRLLGRSQITLTDTTDSRTVSLYLQADNSKQVIYNPNNETHTPDYSENPLTLTPLMYISDTDTEKSLVNNIDKAKSITYRYKINSKGDWITVTGSEQGLVRDGNDLRVVSNLLDNSETVLFRVEVLYEDSNGVDVVSLAEVELVKIALGLDGSDVASAHLTNEYHTIMADTEGNIDNYDGATTTFKVFIGGLEDTTNWNISVEESIGTQGVYDKSTGEYTVTGLATDKGRVVFSASKDGYDTLVKVFSLTRMKAPKPGESAVSYFMELDNSYIKRNTETETLDPVEVQINGKRITGGGAAELHGGYFVVYEQMDGAITIDNFSEMVYESLVDKEKDYVISDAEFPYIKAYQSPTSEQGFTYFPKGNLRKVHIEWYQDPELTNLLDIEQIVVVSDGEDSYRTEVLSVNGNAFKNGVIDTWVYAVVYKGSRDVTATLPENRFIWTRTSTDPEGDALWNERYASGVKEIKITRDDVYKQATFTCSIKKQ